MEIIVILIALVVIILFVKGGIRTFKKRFWLALFLLIFLNPIWIIWAIMEIFSCNSNAPVESASIGKKSKRKHISTDNDTTVLTTSAISKKQEDISPVISPVESALKKKRSKRKHTSTDNSATVLTTSAISKKQKDIRPVVTPRDPRNKIISVEKKKSNTWQVRFKYWYNDQVGYSESSNTIGPSTKGFCLGVHDFDVEWK